MKSCETRSAALSPSSTTRVVRAGIETDEQHGAVVPPLHLSSNYAFESFGEKRQYDYTRSGGNSRSVPSRSPVSQIGPTTVTV